MDFSAIKNKSRSQGDVQMVMNVLQLVGNDNNSNILSKIAYGLGTSDGVSLGLVGNFLDLGDIGVITKLQDVQTGDTLCNPKKPITLEGVDFPAPSLSMAVIVKKKGEEDKVASGLHKLAEEDGLTVRLCPKCHDRLHAMSEHKRDLQIIAEKAWLDHYGKTIQDFIERYGQNYI